MADLYVPSQYPTIQAGINAANTGDTVWVADGIYAGTGNKELGWSGKKITVRSVNGADNCIIDCENSGRGFYLNNAGDCGTISGFTIRNGLATTSGAGIYCNASSPTIINCTISNNSATYGGGICCWNLSSPTIINCTISNNVATNYGGGIYCYWYSSLTITNCTISGNSAGEGGGIGCWQYSSLTITNCTISGNSARWIGGYGGGIWGAYFSSTIINSILWGNNPQEIHIAFQGNVNITYSDIQGGWAGEGNIDANPQFIGNGDYHLEPTSPCIDKGTNIAPGIPTTDKDGKPRILDGNEDGIAIVDMGAYEYGNVYVNIKDSNGLWQTSDTFKREQGKLQGAKPIWCCKLSRQKVIQGWQDYGGEANELTISSGWKRGQRVKIEQDNVKLKGCYLHLGRAEGSGGEQAKITIEADSGGYPSGTALVTAVVSNLPPYYSAGIAYHKYFGVPVWIDLSGCPSLSAGYYWIVAHFQNDDYSLAYNSNKYGDGYMASYNGTAWSSDTAKDLNFRLEFESGQKENMLLDNDNTKLVSVGQITRRIERELLTQTAISVNPELSNQKGFWNMQGQIINIKGKPVQAIERSYLENNPSAKFSNIFLLTQGEYEISFSEDYSNYFDFTSLNVNNNLIRTTCFWRGKMYVGVNSVPPITNHTKIYRNDDGVWTEIGDFSADGSFIGDMIVYEDYLYVSTQAKVRRWNGSAWQDVYVGDVRKFIKFRGLLFMALYGGNVVAIDSNNAVVNTWTFPPTTSTSSGVFSEYNHDLYYAYYPSAVGEVFKLEAHGNEWKLILQENLRPFLLATFQGFLVACSRKDGNNDTIVLKKYDGKAWTETDIFSFSKIALYQIVAIEQEWLYLRVNKYESVIDRAILLRWKPAIGTAEIIKDFGDYTHSSTFNFLDNKIWVGFYKPNANAVYGGQLWKSNITKCNVNNNSYAISSNKVKKAIPGITVYLDQNVQLLDKAVIRLGLFCNWQVYNERIEIWKGFEFPNGVKEYIPAFTGLIQEIEISDIGGKAVINAIDYNYQLQKVTAEKVTMDGTDGTLTTKLNVSDTIPDADGGGKGLLKNATKIPVLPPIDKFPSSGRIKIEDEIIAYAYKTIETDSSYFGKNTTHTWTASTAYSVGAIISPVTGCLWECTTAGTSGTSQPVWNKTLNATTTDNTAVWTCKQIRGADLTTVVAHRDNTGVENYSWYVAPRMDNAVKRLLQEAGINDYQVDQTITEADFEHFSYHGKTPSDPPFGVCRCMCYDATRNQYWMGIDDKLYLWKDGVWTLKGTPESGSYIYQIAVWESNGNVYFVTCSKRDIVTTWWRNPTAYAGTFKLWKYNYFTGLFSAYTDTRKPMYAVCIAFVGGTDAKWRVDSRRGFDIASNKLFFCYDIDPSSSTEKGIACLDLITDTFSTLINYEAIDALLSITGSFSFSLTKDKQFLYTQGSTSWQASGNIYCHKINTSTLQTTLVWVVSGGDISIPETIYLINAGIERIVYVRLYWTASGENRWELRVANMAGTTIATIFYKWSSSGGNLDNIDDAPRSLIYNATGDKILFSLGTDYNNGTDYKLYSIDVNGNIADINIPIPNEKGASSNMFLVSGTNPILYGISYPSYILWQYSKSSIISAFNQQDFRANYGTTRISNIINDFAIASGFVAFFDEAGKFYFVKAVEGGSVLFGFAEQDITNLTVTGGDTMQYPIINKAIVSLMDNSTQIYEADVSSESRKKFGLETLNISNSWMNNSGVAYGIAKKMVELYQLPQLLLEGRLRWYPMLLVNAIATIIKPPLGISKIPFSSITELLPSQTGGDKWRIIEIRESDNPPYSQIVLRKI